MVDCMDWGRGIARYTSAGDGFDGERSEFLSETKNKANNTKYRHAMYVCCSVRRSGINDFTTEVGRRGCCCSCLSVIGIESETNSPTCVSENISSTTLSKFLSSN